MSIYGSLLIMSLVCTRIPYAMARDGPFFRGLARVSPGTRVPARARRRAWAIVLVLSGSFDTLTDYATFSALIFVSLAAAAVFVFAGPHPTRSAPTAPGVPS